MLNNWEDFNKISRKAFEEKELSPPPGMFGDIQKRIFWNNCRLFLKAHALHFTLISTGTIIALIILFMNLNSADHAVIHKSGKSTNEKAAHQNALKSFEQVNKPSIKIELKQSPGYTDSKINAIHITSDIKKNSSNNEISEKSKNGTTDLFLAESQKNERPDLTKNENTPENHMIIIPPDNTIKNKPPITKAAQQAAGEQAGFMDDEKNAEERIPFKSLSPIFMNSVQTIPGLSVYRNKNDYFYQNNNREYNLKIYGGAALAISKRNDAHDTNTNGSDAFNTYSDFTWCESAGLAMDVKLSHFHFQFGIQYSQLQFKYSSNNLLYNSRTDTQTVVSGYNTHVDEHNYYHYTYRLDSVIHTIDSVYTTEYDTSYLPIYELTHHQHYDSLKRASWKETFHLIEVPVTIGYSLNIKNTELTLSGGLIFGYITGSRYSTYAGEAATGPYVPVRSYYNYKSLQLSCIVSLSGTYWLGRHSGIEISPYYRRNLLKLYSNDRKTIVSYNMFGLNLGFIYKF